MTHRNGRTFDAVTNIGNAIKHDEQNMLEAFRKKTNINSQNYGVDINTSKITCMIVFGIRRVSRSQPEVY